MFRTVSDDRYAETEGFRVSAIAFHDQTDIAFATRGNGGLVAVWQDADALNDPGIRMRRYTADGRSFGNDIIVNQVAAGFQGQPDVAVLTGGRFVVTWTDEISETHAFDITAQVFDSNGTRIGGQFIVNTTRPGFQSHPVITALSDGGFAVAWEHDVAGDIRVQLFTNGGTAVGGEIVATDALAEDKIFGDMIGLAGGGFVVSWQHLSEARAQLFDADGDKVGGAFTLNTITAANQEHPTLAALPTGGFVAAWADDGSTDSGTPDNGNQGIWIQLFDATGAKVGDDIRASSLGPLGQDLPRIAIVPGTGFVVVWQDSNGEGDDPPTQLRAQLFDFDANKLGDEYTVNPDFDTAQLLPDVAVLGTGAIAVGWTDREVGGNDDDVYARFFFPITHGTEQGDDYLGDNGRNFYFGHGDADVINGGLEDDGLVGGDGNDRLTAGGGDGDQLFGGAGNDELIGGALMVGGTGNDTYRVSFFPGEVVELAGEGTDTVIISWNSYTLGAHVENGTIVSGYSIDVTGNGLDNHLTAGNGDNELDGAAGADVMSGGWGDDYYVVDQAGDQVIELADSGIDTIEVPFSYSLVGTQLENLVLTGSDPFYGSGNAFVNELTGNDGSNRLNGGAGADTMRGGRGNDLYIVDNVGDRAIETWSSGVDTVESSVTYSIGSYVEKLILTGAAAIDGTGNGLANELTGNAAKNRLDGGRGADILTGGDGGDVYTVDNLLDQVIEASGGGTDVVRSSVDFSLLGQSIERLVLIGDEAIDGTGNSLANILTGNAKANTLKGGSGDDSMTGGDGNDRLFGGAGDDTLAGESGTDGYYFNSALNAATNVDSIVGFSITHDTIFLDRDIFTAIGATGQLDPSAFRSGTAAADASDRIVYDQATGRIFYDADGVGGAAQILFATVTAGQPLTHADFHAYG